MSFNGSGAFNINSTGQPVVTGTAISSTAFNALTADLATGLSTCMTKDGQTTPTAPIKFFAGTVSLPGIIMTDVATGWYRIGANNWGWSGNGAKVLDLSTTGLGVTGAITPTGLIDASGAAAGQVKFPATQNASSNANTLDDYVEGSYTATATGMTTSPTNTFTYTKAGNLVVLNMDGISGTSNAATFTVTGAPAAIRPASGTRDFVARVKDNGGSFVYGMGRMDTSGVITLFLDATGTAWTSSGVKAINSLSASYTI